MQYLFTVILPVYQVEPYLPQCLDSLLVSCGGDVQILLIDDGSTDGSLAICQRYAAMNPSIQVISQQNGGVSGARNTGLKYALGEYLLWVDPDDWVKPQWLSSIRTAIEEQRPDLLIFDYQSWKNGQLSTCEYRTHSGSLEKEQLLADLAEDRKLRSVLWNKVVPRRLFDGLKFDETLYCMEDAEMLCRLLPKIQSIYYLHEPLYVYRIRMDGLVQTPDLASAYRCYQLALERLRLFRQQGANAGEMGVWLQAKGFLCKYYRVGSPKSWSAQYRECSGYLAASRKAIFAQQGLSLADKLKYFLIVHPLVGVGYRGAKQLRTRKKRDE